MTSCGGKITPNCSRPDTQVWQASYGQGLGGIVLPALFYLKDQACVHCKIKFRKPRKVPRKHDTLGAFPKAGMRKESQ